MSGKDKKRYSGFVSVTGEKHEQLKEMARREGCTIQQLIERGLDKAESEVKS